MSEARLVVNSAVNPREIPLTPPGPLTLGRLPKHPIYLPEDEAISRSHAELRQISLASGSPCWGIVDLESRHGTRINDHPIPPRKVTPLRNGDHITAGATTLEFIEGDRQRGGMVASTLEDDASAAPPGSAILEQGGTGTTGSVNRRRFELLQSVLPRLQAAADRWQLAETLVEAAARGTEMENVGVFGLPSPNGDIRIYAARGGIVDAEGRTRISRSMLKGAATGRVMVLSNSSNLAAPGSSLISLGIAEAICVPVACGEVISAILYADQRDSAILRESSDLSSYLSMLAQFGGMALANLHRAEMAARYAAIDADLAIAATAHRFLLKDLDTGFGGLRCEGRSRPGRDVGGDFFRFVRRDHTVRLVLGDVSGHGVGPALLMSAMHGFLRSELRREPTLESLAEAMQEFVLEHREGNTFVTAWIGEIDEATGSLRYLDAGHGHALAVPPDGRPEWLREGGGPPIGIAPGVEYTSATAPFVPGSRLLVVSDGLLEQIALGGDHRGEQFGHDRLEQWLLGKESGRIETLFEAVQRFAGSEELEDDATAILVDWPANS